MILSGSSIEELSRRLTEASQSGTKISGFDLGLNRVVEHTPEDMTVTVEAGITVAALQEHLSRQGQWLPIDPPFPSARTIGGLLALNEAGSRRLGYGTIRDYLLGLKVLLPDGRLIKSGGKVVKNVAGYDLAKLFVGSGGSLGVILEASFKLLPLPAMEIFLDREGTRSETAEIIKSTLNSAMNPIVLDVYPSKKNGNSWRWVMALAGTEEEVHSQMETANTLGFAPARDVNYLAQFFDTFPKTHLLSILPSRLAETLQEIKSPFLAHVGNGLIHQTEKLPLRKNEKLRHLYQRLKDTYDPEHLLPEGPLKPASW